MSASKNLRLVQHAPIENKGPGGQPLYHKNVGLFSEPFLDELISGRVKDTVLLQGWSTEGTKGFSPAYEWMLQHWDKYRDFIPNWSEAELEDKWVRPILEKLGWTYQAQVRVSKYGKKEIPDYALFSDDASYAKARKPYDDENYDAYFSHVLAVADAKKCGVSLDGSKQDNTNPSYQIVWYQKITGKRWGILTDGIYWRLYSAESKNKFSSYYEVNISKFLEERDDEPFKHFFNFFRKEAFVPDQASSQSFLDVVFVNGEIYANEVERKLKDRAFHLVEMICQGFVEHRKPTSEQELKEVYQHSLYYLFRLLFVLNSEAKGLLDIGNQSDYFPYSLRALCDDLRIDFEHGKKWASASVSYNRVNGLFDLIRTGDSRIGIHGLGDEVFASGNAGFYKHRSLPDSCLNQVLLELACIQGKDKRWRFVDYKRLSADHIGSIFEGLLEFSLKQVGSTIQLVNSDGDRKATGAYYTPDYIVDHIIAKTLDPMIEGKSADEILSLKCADIAMGSGHFLLGVVRYLEEAVLERMANDKKSTIDPTEVRWLVLHNCVYGCDINPLAVELSKFSLWIYSARVGFQLEPLADQLVCIDSLGDAKTVLKSVGCKSGFDALVGNPPYVRIQNIESETLVQYQASFRSARVGNVDLYVMFLEQALRLVSSEGRSGFIVPNKFMTAEYGKELRTLLSETKKISGVVHFGDGQVFNGATTYTCLLFLSGREEKKFTLSRPKTVSLDSLESAKHENLPTASLGAEPWTFATSTKSTSSIKTKAPKVLTDYLQKVFVGIQTSADKIYTLSVKKWGSKTLSVTSKALEGEEFEIERGAVLDLLKGSHIERFSKPAANLVVIFPYAVTAANATGLDEKEFKSKFPKAYAYLSKFKAELSAKRDGRARAWFQYDRPQNLHLFQKPKIILQVLTKEGKFFYDDEGKFCFLGGGTAGGNALLLKPEMAQYGHALVAILNSPIVPALLSLSASAFRGGYLAFERNVLSSLPIPDLMGSKDILNSLNRLAIKRAQTKANFEIIDSEMNELVFDLYGISASDRKALTSQHSSGLSDTKGKRAA